MEEAGGRSRDTDRGLPSPRLPSGQKAPRPVRVSQLSCDWQPLASHLLLFLWRGLVSRRGNTKETVRVPENGYGEGGWSGGGDLIGWNHTPNRGGMRF